MLAHTIDFLIRVIYRRQSHIGKRLSGYCAPLSRVDELEACYLKLRIGQLIIILCYRRLGKLSEQPHVGFAIKQVFHLYASPTNGSVEVGAALACCVVQVVLAISILGVALCYFGIGNNMQRCSSLHNLNLHLAGAVVIRLDVRACDIAHAEIIVVSIVAQYAEFVDLLFCCSCRHCILGEIRQLKSQHHSLRRQVLRAATYNVSDVAASSRHHSQEHEEPNCQFLDIHIVVF